MAAKKTELSTPAENVQAFKVLTAAKFQADFDKWKARVGEIEIVGKTKINNRGTFTELIYWRPKKKSVVSTSRSR